MRTTKLKWPVSKNHKKTASLLRSGMLILLISLSFQSAVKAQDRVTPTWWFGAAGGANFNFYRGTVQILNADLSTQYAFTNGFGVAPYFALFAEYRPNKVWGLMFNVAYDARRGIFNRSNASPNSTIVTTLNAEFDYIAFEPSLRIAPFAGNFYIFLGPRLSYNVSSRFLYEVQFQANNEAAWSDVYGIRISGQIGVGYEIPLSKPDCKTQLNLSPFVSFIPYFGEQPRSIENLSLTTVRAGIAIKIGCGPKKEVPAAAVVVPVPVEPVVEFSVQAPKAIPGQRVVKETLPLCNYVFFDAGSTEIPARYVVLTKNQAAGFKEEQLQDCQKNPGTRPSRQLTMYHNVLNIIADRMRRYPNSTITLVGASAGKGSEIGKANAVAVKSYLVDVFGIDASRIAVEGRNRPLIPSEKPNNIRDTNMINVEDSRVDIVSASPDLMMEIKDNSALCLKPVEVTALDGSSLNDAQVFVNADGAGAGLKSWSVDVTDAAGNTQHFGPFTGDKQTLSASAILQDHSNGTYKMVMTGWTNTGHAMTKESSFSLSRQSPPAIPEHRVSILFEFDKSKTVSTFDKFLTNNVAPLITSNSTVIISGYTDIVGTPEHNLTLSADRAKEAQTILEDATAKAGVTGVTYKTNGYGEEGVVFPNTLPEERFYNRTVVIDISPSETVVTK